MIIQEILPNLVKINYEQFDYIDKAWEVTQIKYGKYLWPFSDVEHHKLYFHLIKNACENKKMIIRNPMYAQFNQNEIIESDVYFLTKGVSNEDVICNYYYKNENIVLGIFLGTGNTGLNITIAYIIYFENKHILTFYHAQEHLNNNLINLVFSQIKIKLENLIYEDIDNQPSQVSTIEGYNFGLWHTCATFVNGIHLMQEIGIKNNIDNLIIGPNDPFLIEKYYKNKYPNLKVIKGLTTDELINDNKFYKGVLFKYSHFYLTNKRCDYIKNCINDLMPINNSAKNEIEYIKNNFYPIFSINIRCFTCQIKDKEIIYSEIINKLKNIYKNSYFFIGGFLGDYNEELLINQNTEIGTKNGKYDSLLLDYENTVELIKQKLTHNDYKSLINLKIHNVIEYTKIVNFSIHTNCGYKIIECALHNIPSLFFGTKWISHTKGVEYVSKESFVEPVYIEDETKIKYLSNDVYDNITCEVSSDVIVEYVLANFVSKLINE
jgi:hypothetical protein